MGKIHFGNKIIYPGRTDLKARKERKEKLDNHLKGLRELKKSLLQNRKI
jgi:hypothetical protein